MKCIKYIRVQNSMTTLATKKFDFLADVLIGIRRELSRITMYARESGDI